MKSFLFKTKWDNSPKAYIVEKTYSNPSNLCLEVVDPHFGSLCVATTNIAGYHCDPGNVLIKNWAENEGVYKALFDAGVVGPIIRKVPTGFVVAYECKYLGGKNV